MQRPIAHYREFLPGKALQSHVRAFFSFTPGSSLAPSNRPLLRDVTFGDSTFCSPQLADGHVSIVFELGQKCEADGRWHEDALALHGTVTGPMTGVGRIEGSDLPEMVGVYFRPGRLDALFRVAISELTDRAIAISDLWGTTGTALPGELRDLNEASRIDRLESVLIKRLADGRQRDESLDVPGLAASIRQRHGRVTVEGLAHAAGVSRQHLARAFREGIGVSPKVYSRLARFHAMLGYAASHTQADWASAAVDLGYADQSHMIAECRRFSGLTPHTLASGHRFHPFIERARALRDDRDPRGKSWLE